MIKQKHKLFLNLFSVFCCLFIVIISASGMESVQSTAQLIGLIAGSFGAGAALVNTIRDYSVDRSEKR
jgi:4-hydroxybenzoate polyprenyltransferase